MGELSDISGDEVQDVNVHAPLTDQQRWHLMARQLHRDVKTLRDEQVLNTNLTECCFLIVLY